jgi:flavin reductase (DIM6/NTAB) family NADH-FMN oxidoreductase RutF
VPGGRRCRLIPFSTTIPNQERIMTISVPAADSAQAADPGTFREVMGHCPSTVAVVTTMTATGPIGCAATAFLSLSVDPPALVVSLDSHSRTLSDITGAGRFAVNLLSQDQHELVRTFSQTHRDHRFDQVDYLVEEGVPLLAQACATLSCRLTQAVPALDHTLLVGLVVALDRASSEPLLINHGRPHRALPIAVETPDIARAG